MKFTVTLLALAIAAAAPNAFAQSADLTITGKIMPGSCNITLGNGGVADLGSIPTRDLNADTHTELAPVPLSMNVVCDAEIRFALKGVDNAVGGSAFGVLRPYGLGLTPDQEKIGGAGLVIREATADGDPTFATYSTDNGATWDPSGVPGPTAAITEDALLGYAKTEGVTTGPDAITSLVGIIDVNARIAPANELTIAGEVPIAGNVGVELFYQ